MDLPCERLRHRGPDCADVKWEYFKSSSSVPVTKVSRGIVQNSDSRLKINGDCSLGLESVTEDDAGVFRCNFEDDSDFGTSVYVNVLTGE